jgi:hypothetical protein
MVVSNDGKRLEFDLAPDIADSDDDDDDEDDDDEDDDDDDEDDNPFRGMTSFKLSSASGAEKSIRELDVSSNVVDDEAAMWAAYAAADISTNNDEEEEEEDDDEYDEDADIEDALGIGSW